MVHRHRASNQGGKTEVDGERDGPITNEPDPTRDKGQHFLV